MSVAQTEKKLRASIVAIISYGALYGFAYTDTEILGFLNVKASIVGLRNNLSRMVAHGLLQIDKTGRYQLKSYKYPNQNTKQLSWQQIIDSAKKHTRLLKSVPFIKAIVVLPQSESQNIRIVVVTLPARLHIARLIVEKYFAGRSLTNSKGKQIEVIDNLYFTTAGLRFLEEFGWSDLDRIICLLSAKPIFGANLWNSLLEKNQFIRANSPNYLWPRSQPKVYASSIRTLDSFEDKSYRAFLRSMANKPEYRHGGSLQRIRPDVIIADPYASRNNLLGQRFNQIKKKF
jgi:hypothetical protein